MRHTGKPSHGPGSMRKAQIGIISSHALSSRARGSNAGATPMSWLSDTRSAPCGPLAVLTSATMTCATCLALAACGGTSPAPAPTGSRPAAPPSRETTSSTPSSSTLGGLLQQVSWWDARYPTVQPARCTAAGESVPIGTAHAWQLSSGAIACFDDLGSSLWRHHVIGVDLFFPTPVSQQRAIAAGTGVLPPDAVRAATFDGVNPDYSKIPNGSCREILYKSNTLRTRLVAVNPTWKDDPSKATIDLYSGNATTENGADKPYDSNHVHLALVGIGSENRGADGIVHC